jgi:hypothetical protein
MFSLFNNFNDAGILNSLINTFTKPNFSDIIKEPTNVDLDEIDNSDGIFLNNTITDDFVNNIIQSLYEKLNDKLDKSNTNYPYTILPYKDGYSIIQIPYYETNGFNKYINIFILNPYFVLFNTSFKNWVDNKDKFPNVFFDNVPSEITTNPQNYQLVLSFYDPNNSGQLIYSDFNFPYKIVNGIKKYYYCFYQLVDPNVNSGSTINYNLEIFPGQTTFNLDMSDPNTEPKTFTSSILSETQGTIPTATYSYLQFAESFITDSILKFVFTIQNCFNFKNTTPGYTSRGFVPYNGTLQDFSQCQFIPYKKGIDQLDTLIQSGNVDFTNITSKDINYYINGQTPLITNNGNYSITHTHPTAQQLGPNVFTTLSTQNAATDVRTIKFGVNPTIPPDENLYATTGSTYTSFSDIADSINNANIAAGTYGLNGIYLDSSNSIKTSSPSSISDNHKELYKYINTNFNGEGNQFTNLDGTIINNTYLLTSSQTVPKQVDWTDPNNPSTYQYVDRTSTTNQFNTASEWEQRTTTNNPFIYDSSFITVLNNDNPTSGKPFGWNYCTQTDNNTDPNNTGIKIPDNSTTAFNKGITTRQDLAVNQLWECGNCFNTLDQFGPCNRPESANSYWYYNSGELEGTPSGPTEDFKLMRTNMKIEDKNWKYIDGADLATNFTYTGILPLVSNRTDSYSCTNWKSCPDPSNCPDQGNPYNIMTILNGTGSDQVSGQTVYGCLLNDTNLKSGSNFPEYSGRCDSDPNCAITAGIGIYPVSTTQSLWDGQKNNKPSSYDETTLGFGFNIKLGTGISYSELVNSFGLNNTQLTSCNIYNLSPIIGPLSDKYICNPNGSGTQGTWNSGGQGPDSWCFNIGSPYIQNYTTDGNGKLSPSSTFYFKVQTNGIYYNIINDPSITFGFDQPVTSSPFLWTNGAPYQQSSQCLYDIYNNVISDNTMSFNLNALNPSSTNNTFKIYGILSNATGITAPCNSAINYKTDGTPDNPHELRINFNGALGVANKQNDYFLIDQDGLSQGYVTYFINQNC